MKPYYNDDFSKMLVEKVAYSMMEASEKCNHSGAGTSCPLHGDADCNSSKQNRKEEFEVLESHEIEVDGETIIIEKVKMDGKDDNGFKSCWKGYRKAGTKIKGGKEVNNCVKAGYEMEGEEELDEVAPPGAKYERMVKHIKKGYSKGGLTDKEKSIAYATAWKAKGKATKEEWEGGKEDKEEDKKLAKKHKMSMKDWEKSAADKKHDMKKEEVEKEEKGEKKHKEGKAEEKKEKMKEARNLPGNQEKIDANKNGKIDAHDFAILRNKRSKKTVKEMWELAAEAKAQIEVMPEIDDKDPGNVKRKEKKEKEDK